MGVQQKLMRHAQISTTMNVYGNALMEAKREVNLTNIFEGGTGSMKVCYEDVHG